MILPGGLVEFPIINARTPTSDRPLSNESFFSLRTTVIPLFSAPLVLD
jgi:hypothetical protein